MPNYQNGKIYVLKRTKDDKTFYVGSTINPLSKRLWGHNASLSKDTHKHLPVYKYINKKGGKDAFYIELYKRYPCQSIEELRKFEGRVIRRLKGNGINLKNVLIAGRAKKETAKLREKTEKRIAYKKEYKKTKVYKDYHKKYDKMRASTYITCECGRQVIKSNIAIHKKTTIHQRLMALKENDE